MNPIARWFKDKDNIEKNYAISITTIFLIFGAVILSRHEMWRDELQAWLLAKDSMSISGLCANLRYEPHASLWHLCLFLLTRVTTSPCAMQVLHLLIAASTVYIFCRFAPFQRLHRTLFAFGYFPFYEYSVISRDYALSFLLLFSFCSLFPKRRTSFPLLACVLFLFAQMNTYSFMVTIAITAGLIMERRTLSDNPVKPDKKIRELIGFAIIAMGLIFFIAKTAARPGIAFNLQWVTYYIPSLFSSTMSTIVYAFFPIPLPNAHFWNTNMLDLLAYPVFEAIIILISSWSLIVLFRKPAAFLVYYLGTAMLLAFTYMKYYGFTRHHGFIFMLFIASLWMSYYCSDGKNKGILYRVSSYLSQRMKWPLAIILAAHIIGSGIAVSEDYLLPFSQAKAAAEFIKRSNMEGMIIVGDADTSLSTLAGYLSNRIYYVRGHRLGSFIIWDKTRNPDPDPYDIIEYAKTLSGDGMGKVLIILSSEMDKHIIAKYPITEVTKFDNAIVEGENYYIYLYGKKGSRK